MVRCLAGKNHCHINSLAASLFFCSRALTKNTPAYPRSTSNRWSALSDSKCADSSGSIVWGSGTVLSFRPLPSCQKCLHIVCREFDRYFAVRKSFGIVSPIPDKSWGLLTRLSLLLFPTWEMVYDNSITHITIDRPNNETIKVYACSSKKISEKSSIHCKEVTLSEHRSGLR